MNIPEFDKFADEYTASLRQSLGFSGEGPEYFAEYKVRDVLSSLQKKKLTARKVLDFGCGIGGSMPYFQRLLPSAELTGVDVSEKSLDIARTRFPGLASYRSFDGRVLPFGSDTFDVVFTACVFHHIPEEQHVSLLSEIRRVLTPGGIFFIFEHNPLNPLTIRVVNQCPFDENAVLISAKRLRARLMAAGFRSVQTRYRIFFPHFLRALRGLEPGLAWCPLGAQYYLAAGK